MDYKKAVTIERRDVKGSNIKGIILGESETILLIQYIYDFKLDGLMVLAQSDITAIPQSKSDIFYTKKIKELGLYKQIPFKVKYDLSSWKSFFRTIKKDYRFFTVEEEHLNDCCSLGKIHKIQKDRIKMKTFTSRGRWEKKLSHFFYEDISCVQVGDHYANVFEEHFKNMKTK